MQKKDFITVKGRFVKSENHLVKKSFFGANSFPM